MCVVGVVSISVCIHSVCGVGVESISVFIVSVV